ncbi:TPA: ATP-binding protein [Klebsiella pneumoniae]|nr:ATP-binding protein [Enterobacter vonholyi]HBR6897016.1 ATP-binding protein [Klebsiella pneumoniae]
MSNNYAGLLADKLDERGEARYAKMIRDKLNKMPTALVSAQKGDGGFSFNDLPVDNDSRLNTVDVSIPTLHEDKIILSESATEVIDDFIANIDNYDKLYKFNAALPNRIILFGKPGTGKTRLARHIAARLSLRMLTVRCDTLVSSLLGQTSKNLRKVFEYSSTVPCVLFLDEFDALASARGNERDIGELQRIVIALLQNIDSLPENVIVIAATNHENLLDPAIWRRFSFKLPMYTPDENILTEIWRDKLGQFISKDVDINYIAKKSLGVTGSTVEQISLDCKRKAILSNNNNVDEVLLLKKIAFTMAQDQNISLKSKEDEIRWLRSWDEKKFSLRVLSKLYNLSVRGIGNIVKENNYHGKQSI